MGDDIVIGTAREKMASMMMLGLTLGGPKIAKAVTKILEAPEGEYEGEDGVARVQKELGLGNLPENISLISKATERISPDLFFISAGPGAIEDRYYACIMKPDPNSPDGFRVIAKMNYGFGSSRAAKDEAAKQYPFVPVLIDGKYEYPYASKAEFVERLRAKQDEKEARRVARMLKSMEKQHD